MQNRGRKRDKDRDEEMLRIIEDYFNTLQKWKNEAKEILDLVGDEIDSKIKNELSQKFKSLNDAISSNRKNLDLTLKTYFVFHECKGYRIYAFGRASITPLKNYLLKKQRKKESIQNTLNLKVIPVVNTPPEDEALLIEEIKKVKNCINDLKNTSIYIAKHQRPPKDFIKFTLLPPSEDEKKIECQAPSKDKKKIEGQGQELCVYPRKKGC